jgi:hypothetical protein
MALTPTILVLLDQTAQRVQALTMGRFRQRSRAWRVAISAFALYALLLQGFLAASAPATAFAEPVAL